jgi:cytochrome c biogenesis protein CcmG/thiol:disulfide interchange protein DsbE
MRHLRWLLVPVIVLPLAWLLYTGFSRDPSEIASPVIGQPAPIWGLETLDGEDLSTEDLAGRPYVLNFWASWCIPACVDEHPVLADAFEATGVTIVGVVYQDDPINAQAFLIEYGDAGYAHVVDEDGWVAVDYGVTGPPETFFIDAEGIIRAKQFGPLTAATMAEHLATIGVER